MGLNYLWDTNAVIYFLQKNFSESVHNFMGDIMNDHKLSISVITEIELLCWKTANDSDYSILNSFVSDFDIFQLDEAVKLKTIEIRKVYNIKLPDAIIAATAITKNLTLISNDKKGFNKIMELNMINPFAIN